MGGAASWKPYLLRDPPHPGETIRADCMEGATVAETARKLGVSLGELSPLLDGRTGIPAAMADKLEAAGWSTADCWLRLQAQYDSASQSNRLEDERSERVAAQRPFSGDTSPG